MIATLSMCDDSDSGNDVTASAASSSKRSLETWNINAA